MNSQTEKTFDTDTDLYYNARWYDPQLGRFITEDPIKDGQMWYGYVNSNPIRYTDPTGLQGESIVEDNIVNPIISENVLSDDAQVLLQNIENVLDDADVQNGVLDANGNPGTWCNRAADRIGNNSGIDMEPALNARGIWLD